MLSGFIAAQDAAIPAGRTTYGVYLPVYGQRVLTHNSDHRFVSRRNRATTPGAPHFNLEPIPRMACNPHNENRDHEFGPIRLAIFRQLHPFASVICGD